MDAEDLIEAGRWRGRPRWTAPPEPRAEEAPRAALLGATNRLGTGAARGARAAPTISHAVDGLRCRSADAASDAVCPDDSVLMGSPERALPPRSRAAAIPGTQTAEAAQAATVAGAVCASTTSASMLQGSVVMPPSQHGVSGMWLVHQ